MILLKGSTDAVEQGRTLLLDDDMMLLMKDSKVPEVQKIAGDCHELLKEVMLPPIIPPPVVEEKKPTPPSTPRKRRDGMERSPMTSNHKHGGRGSINHHKKKPEFNLNDIEQRMAMQGHEEDEPFHMPASAKNWLLAGKIITVITEDMKKKKLHFFLTRDMKTFVCKEPKKAKVLQDFACKVSKIYDVTKEYKKSDTHSPFVKSCGFFERKPDENLCFTITGPVSRHGRANLYMICDTPLEATKWVEYIELAREQDRVNRSLRLTR